MNCTFVVMRVGRQNTAVEAYYKKSLIAPLYVIVPDPLQTDEWNDFEFNGSQAWFSNQSMTFHEAITYCDDMDSILFEPYNQVLYADIIDGAKRAGLAMVWLGITDVEEEGV